MNHILTRNRVEAEVAQIRAIVDRYPFPDFITGYDVRLGEFDGDPAVWIEFDVLPREDQSEAAAVARAEATARIRHQVGRYLIDEIEDRFPYFRFRAVAKASPCPE